MIGAREHYALPRALDRIGQLSQLYTDAWAGPILRRVGYGAASLKGLADRWHPDLAPQQVTRFTVSSVGRSLYDRSRRSVSREELFRRFLTEGRRFARRVRRSLERGAVRPAGLIGYNTGCLESQEFLAANGIPSIVDQIDPARSEEEIVLAEAEKWPNWQSLSGRIPEEYFSRLEAEWRLATKVIVNSEWSRDALVSQGVPAGKLAVVPLCYEPSATVLPRRPVCSDPVITVLWLGQVNLRKGIQYLFQAAAALADRPIRFMIAGPVGISRAAVASAPRNVTVIGPVPRSKASEYYRTADLFVLPTLSDGFAITQLEAMSYGLPVVTTERCGRVVDDGINGRVVSAGDAFALAAAIDDLAGNPERMRDMSRAASETVRRFSLSRFADDIRSVVSGIHTPSGARSE